MVDEIKRPGTDGATTLYVWVKDGEGNEFLCPLDALIDPRKAPDDRLKNSIDHGNGALDPGHSTIRLSGRAER